MEDRIKLLKKYIKVDTMPNNCYEYQLLLSKLKKVNVPTEKLKKLSPSIDIDDDKILCISDTHYGLGYENYSYIDLVYEFAKKHGINTIIHGGDFVQGSAAPQKQFYDLDKDRNLMKCDNLYEQITRAYDKYPEDDYINNYLLLGNHDYLMVKKYEELIDFLSSRKDINVLGVKKAYINWRNYLISINHRIPKFNMYIPRVSSLIKFHGHRHEFNYKTDCDNVFLPTLSDDLKYYGDVNYPGFVVVSMSDDIEIKFYPIINGRVVEDCPSLRKSLDERARIH